MADAITATPSLDALGEVVDQVCKFERLVKSAKDMGLVVPIAISQAIDLLQAAKILGPIGDPTGYSADIGHYYFFTESRDLPESLVRLPLVKKRKIS